MDRLAKQHTSLAAKSLCGVADGEMIPYGDCLSVTQMPHFVYCSDAVQIGRSIVEIESTLGAALCYYHRLGRQCKIVDSRDMRMAIASATSAP